MLFLYHAPATPAPVARAALRRERRRDPLTLEPVDVLGRRRRRRALRATDLEELPPPIDEPLGLRWRAPMVPEEGREDGEAVAAGARRRAEPRAARRRRRLVSPPSPPPLPAGGAGRAGEP